MSKEEPVVHLEAASTLAVVVLSNEPLLFLSADQKVIAASTSFCRTFEIDPATIPGRALSELGNGEWAMPKLASLLKATASRSARIEAYEIDLKRGIGGLRGARGEQCRRGNPHPGIESRHRPGVHRRADARNDGRHQAIPLHPQSMAAGEVDRCFRHGNTRREQPPRGKPVLFKALQQSYDRRRNGRHAFGQL